MSKTSQDKDFEAAVLQLKAGDRKNLLKFGAMLVMTFMMVVGIAYVIAAVQHAVEQTEG